MSDVTQAAGTIVGGIIGFALGGPAGAAKGAALGYSLTAPKPDTSPTYSFDSKYNTASQTIPVPVAYGRNLIAGNTIFKNVSGEDSENMDIQIAVSEGPIQSITAIKANDVDITSRSRAKLGDRIQTADSINSEGQTFPYTAYISTHLTADEDISGSPAITAIVEGRKVDVWDGSQWVNQYSQNPAYCLLDFLTNKRYGLGISKDDIDLESFITTAEYCDELVDGEPRFQLDYVVDFQQSSLDHIRDILSTFRGFMVYSNGEFRLKVDGPEAPVQALTMDNIVENSFSYWKTSRKERYNRVIVEYTDPDNHWEKTGAQYSLDSDIARNTLRDKTVPLYGINRFSQAGRMTKYIQKMTWYCPTFCQFKVGIDSLHCEAGDVITVSHEVPGWVAKEFRILEVKEEENDEMTLTCQEYNVAVYNDSGVIQQVKKDTILPNPWEAPGSVNSLVLSKEIKRLNDGTWLSNIVVNWSNPPFGKYGTIYISDDNGQTWRFVQKVEGTYYVITNVQQSTTYLVRVVSESRKGLQEAFDTATTSSILIPGKEIPPDDVQILSAQLSNNNVILKWAKVDDKDIEGYEIRRGESWNLAAAVVKDLKANYINLGELQPGDWVFHVKAVDTSGNYSVNPATTEITTFDLKIKNVVQTFHDDYTTGTFTNTEQYYDSVNDDYFLATSQNGDTPITGYDYLPCYKQGEYLSPVFSLNKIKKVRAYINYSLSARGKSLEWEDFGDITWEQLVAQSVDGTWLGLIDVGSINISLRYSADNVNWDEIPYFIDANVNARYFQIKVEFNNVTELNQLILGKYDLVADVEDVIDGGINNVNGTATINYNYGYYDVSAIKSIRVDALGDNDYQAKVVAFNADNFDVKVFDSVGSPVQTDVSWQVIGY